MATRHSPELKAKVVAEYAGQPDSINEIAARHDVARSTVVRWSTDAGLHRASKRKKRQDKKRQEKNVLETSPKVLKDSDGAWVYGTDGIGRWQPHGGVA